MRVGSEQMDEFEIKLRQALERRPAPPGLKQRILHERSRRRTLRIHSRAVLWQRLAASLVLAATAGGSIAWHHFEEQRKGEAARQQVLTALRITARALDTMQARLRDRDRGKEQ